MFRQHFTETIEAFGAGRATADALWADIAARYSGEDRHYHNLGHLDTMLGELSGLRSRILDWDVLMLALAYHDIIYNNIRGNNEAASAEYARSKLRELVPADRLQHCTELILATKRHEPGEDPDAAYFTDADLAILGSAPDRYQSYSEQIRKEYRQFPDLIYKSGRRAVLQRFLDMPRIFRTEEFYQRYEKQARKNMQAELDGFRTRS